MQRNQREKVRTDTVNRRKKLWAKNLQNVPKFLDLPVTSECKLIEAPAQSN